MLVIVQGYKDNELQEEKIYTHTEITEIQQQIEKMEKIDRLWVKVELREMLYNSSDKEHNLFELLNIYNKVIKYSY